jgi:hypothetical protein
VPYFDWSRDAPTTAYFGADKNVFLISAKADIIVGVADKDVYRVRSIHIQRESRKVWRDHERMVQD